MKVYVSGPPVSNIHDEQHFHALLYKTIAEKLRKNGHDVELPIRSAELDKMDAKEFCATMSKRIADSESVITIFDSSDQSTPVEATIASSYNKPQFILEIADAPRMVRGLQGVVGRIGISHLEMHNMELLERTIIEALMHLRLTKPEARAA